MKSLCFAIQVNMWITEAKEMLDAAAATGCYIKLINVSALYLAF